MKQHIHKAGLGAGAIVLCGLVAYGFSSLLSVHRPSGLGFGILGALVTTLGIRLRLTPRWQLADFLLSLAVAEAVAVLVAFTLLLPPFSPWRWLAKITLFVAPPWILGHVLGTAAIWAAGRQEPIFVRSWMLAGVYALCGVVALVLVPELRHAYGQFAAPLPRITLLFVRVSPDAWFFLGLAFGALAIFKDLVFRQRWVNQVLPIPLVPLALALFLPLI